MKIDDALAYLDQHINLEATAGRVAGLSLDPITELMGHLGDPQTAYPVIHVTGTNGKGSTAAMISELLLAHGLSVGQYTSPHLVTVNERMARNGVAIADDELAEAIQRIALVEDHTGLHPSYFEIVTAAALSWFADVGVEVAVVEVGLLGAWDATNVVDASVAVVTNVGKDHTDGTPGWAARVAIEKAGIIKPGSDAVIGESAPELQAIFSARPAASRWLRPEDFAVESDQLAVGGRLVDLRTPRGVLEGLFLPLHGAHQSDNAAVAATAVEVFFDRPLDADVVGEAFGRVRVPGRFEIVGRNPLVVLDGAHNPDSAEALAATLADFNVGRRVLVIGLLGGRDVDEMAAAFHLVPGDLVIACTPDNPRAVPAVDLASAVDRLGVAVDVVEDAVAAVDAALGMVGEDDGVVVTGSLYVVGAARPGLVAPDHQDSDNDNDNDGDGFDTETVDPDDLDSVRPDGFDDDGAASGWPDD
jgi:dihydrofolate synthase/folylpolyglutamate synthase